MLYDNDVLCVWGQFLGVGGVLGGCFQINV